MRSVFKIQAEIEITKNGMIFLNHKRIALLKQIRLTGSILAASKSLGMSYQMAWTYIKEMNKLSPLPIVTQQRGGTNGGGAQLTRYGLTLIETFRSIESKQHEFLNDMEDEIKTCFF
jgi:molybdate transport system regulatory protein